MRAILLLLCCAAANAHLVSKNWKSGDSLHLLREPCTHAGTLAKLPKEFRDRFSNARVLDYLGHIRSYGCWAQEGRDIKLLFEDGEAIMEDRTRFIETEL